MKPNGRDHAAATAGDSGLALALADGATLLPISPGGCLALARAVVAGMAAETARHAASWREAARDPAVAAWLAAEGIGPEPSQPRAADLAIRLRGAVVEATRASRPFAPRADTLEGGMLVDALEAAASHHALVTRFEQQVAEARLESLRELAYGAGHEINNPLANIATRAQTLLLDERDPDRRRRLATIVDQAFRARDLIGGLMLFARPPRPRPTIMDVERLVESVVEFLAPLAAQRGIRLEAAPGPGPWVVSVDRPQVEESLRAVVSNALEAVGEGGRVTVSVGSGRTPDRCVVTVGDDGPGIDAATLRRVFDPFFSGREAGRGAGLGLSKAWRFLEANGGAIEIESRAGRGTRVTITLPLAATPGAPAAGHPDALDEQHLSQASSLSCANPPVDRGGDGKVAAESPA